MIYYLETDCSTLINDLRRTPHKFILRLLFYSGYIIAQKLIAMEIKTILECLIISELRPGSELFGVGRPQQ
jgi:hypothetical protein